MKNTEEKKQKPICSEEAVRVFMEPVLKEKESLQWAGFTKTVATFQLQGKRVTFSPS